MGTSYLPTSSSDDVAASAAAFIIKKYSRNSICHFPDNNLEFCQICDPTPAANVVKHLWNKMLKNEISS